MASERDLTTKVLEKEQEVLHLERRKELLRRAWRIIVVVLACGLVVLLSSVLLKIKDAAESAEHAAKSADETTAIIKSCTTPNGKCAKEGQEAQRDAIGKIGEIIYFSAICQTQLEHEFEPNNYPDSKLIDCVAAKLFPAQARDGSVSNSEG